MLYKSHIDQHERKEKHENWRDCKTHRVEYLADFLKKNKTLEEMADELEEGAETIQPLYEIVIKYAPAYNEDEIMEETLRSKD